MQRDIERILIDRDAIDQRIEQLAEQMAADLRTESHDGQPAEVTLVPILTGSLIFVADLMRRLPMRMQIHMMSITSYPGRATTSRGASVEAGLTQLPESLAGLHVLLIDDILDSGQTLRLASQTLRQRQPTSLRTCVLLRKRRDEAMQTPVDYVAFDIPDEFVVGYGLDFDGYYRNLPDIVTLKRDVVEGQTEAGQQRPGVPHGSTGMKHATPESHNAQVPAKVRFAEGAASEAGQDAAALRAAAMLPVELLQPGELIILLLKPSPWFIVLAPLKTLVVLVLLVVAAGAVNAQFGLGIVPRDLALVGVGLVGARLFWQFLEWLSRVYVLTDQRVIRVQGVLRVYVFEARLREIQHTELLFSIRERVFGLGTVAFATAGTAISEAYWQMVAHPLHVHQKVVETLRRYRR